MPPSAVSWVHSENLISATSSGFTQCTVRSASTPWGKGLRFVSSFLQHLPDLLQHGLIEAGARLTHMNQFSLLVIEAQHDRAEI